MPDSRRPRLVFATHNRGKLVELRELLAGVEVELLSLDDIEVPDVIEDGETFEENATKKAREVSAATGLPALADDSGLEVDALGGAPGVRSARYAGLDSNDDRNNDKLIEALAAVPAGQRTARFRSCLALADVDGPLGEQTLTAHGTCEGEILAERRGSGGFGYDPLFYVADLQGTFAELGIGTKNDRSHRAMAMRAMRNPLVEYLAALAKRLESG